MTQQEHAQLVAENRELDKQNAHLKQLLGEKDLEIAILRAEAYRAVEELVRRYNTRRLHSSLHYLSPAEFYRRHMKTGLQPRRRVRV